MELLLPIRIVPHPDSEAVKRLRKVLNVEAPAVTVRVVTEPHARERDCYVNVRDKVEREGGKTQLGWAVWQHANLFIEAEPHAVFDPGGGLALTDCTPHTQPDGTQVSEILFISNDEGSYDFNTTDTPDNVRVPLVEDTRVIQALKLFSERTALMNSVPGVDVQLPFPVAKQVQKLNMSIARLLSAAMQPATVEARREKIGRNDLCPCGSGKKYKRCHGS